MDSIDWNQYDSIAWHTHNNVTLVIIYHGCGIAYARIIAVKCEKYVVDPFGKQFIIAK